MPSYGEIITAAQTPNHSHLFHASGPFRHNCRHLAPAVVHCLTNCSHFGSQLLHTAFKRQGILAGMRISIVKLSKYQNPYETDCHPVFIIVQATLLCSIEGICQFLTSNMGPPIHRNQQTPQSTTLRTVNRLHGITDSTGNHIDSTQPNIDTSNCKPSTEELLQQATEVRRPTLVRPVSQVAPVVHHTAAPIGRQTRSHGPTDITSLFNQPSPPDCHMKEANCPGKPSKYICPNHP